jgi:hypothetical protein
MRFSDISIKKFSSSTWKKSKIVEQFKKKLADYGMFFSKETNQQTSVNLSQTENNLLLHLLLLLLQIRSIIGLGQNWCQAGTFGTPNKAAQVFIQDQALFVH